MSIPFFHKKTSLPHVSSVVGARLALYPQAGQARQQNRADREAQARLHGVEDSLLDLQAEENELAARERRLAVREQAGEIIARTREAIISHVMPLTIHNMDRLLPLLTDGRYHQAQWNEEQSAISVYDGQARAYQRKSVFSGGARDQISLALRLAFAIATLPGEHSIRPGWLFLDEPLSSFDRQRTLALVELLTKGLIRREFDQIFLVSHSEAFDPGLFDHRIRIEQGRVVTSTLSQIL